MADEVTNTAWLDGVEGITDAHKAIVTEKGFTGIPALLDALPGKETVWTDGLPTEVKGMLESKGFKDLPSLAKSYENLEALKGVPPERLLTIPEKPIDEDPKAWEALHARLGRPEKPEDYEIKMDEGPDSEKLLGWAKSTFHELGLTKKQAEGFIDKWNALSTSDAEEVKEKMQAEVAKAEKELKTEWALAYDQNRALAEKAAKTLGITPDDLAKLNDSLGDARIMKILHGVGTKIGLEDKFEDGGDVRSGFLTPAAAQHRMSELKRDTEFVKKIQNNDADAVAKWNRLQEMAFAEPAEGATG